MPSLLEKQLLDSARRYEALKPAYAALRYRTRADSAYQDARETYLQEQLEETSKTLGRQIRLNLGVGRRQGFLGGSGAGVGVATGWRVGGPVGAALGGLTGLGTGLLLDYVIFKKKKPAR